MLRALRLIDFHFSTLPVGGMARVLALILLAMLLALSAHPSLAATINVDSSCSLANAIRSANGDTQQSPNNSCETGGSGADTITLSANVTLSADLPRVTSTITVQGNGYTIDGADSHHMFFVTGSGNLTINNITLTQSQANSRSNNYGGAIYAWQGQVTVTNSAIRDSYASSDGGAMYVSGAQSNLTISNSSIISNSVGSIAGGISFAGATATLTHVTLHDNLSAGASNAIPSGVFISSNSFSIRNSIIASSDDNQDCFLGSGVSLSQNIGNLIEDNSCSPAASGDPSLSADSRGALLPGSGSPVLGLGNAAICKQYNLDQFGVRRPESGCDAGAVERGGYKDIYVDSGVDNTATPFSACNLREAITSANENSNANADGCVAGVEDEVGRDVIWLQVDSTLNTEAPEITSNIFMEGGGHRITTTQDIRLLSVASGGDFILRDVELSGGNPDGDGGAMAVAGKLWLEDCVIKDNSTTSTADGGAISFSSGSNATIDRCAFINNRSAYQGGAVMIAGGSVNIRNSTFTKNHSANNGGAIAVTSGTVTLAQLTVWDNTSASAGLVTGIVGAGTVNMYNSIIGRSETGGGVLCGGSFNNSITQRGIITWNGPQSDNCGTVTVADPRLGALTGSIPYLPLQAGSPAIGAGIDAQCAAYTKDQLGNARPATGCDIGAVQYFAQASTALVGSGGVSSSGSGSGGPPATPIGCSGDWLNAASDLRLSASFGLCNGIQFQRLDAGGIGIQRVVESGFLDAVDVWGWARPTIEVCFPQAGKTLFLDAAASPRTASPLASFREGAFTCARVGKAGTVVLMAPDSPLGEPPADTAPGPLVAPAEPAPTAAGPAPEPTAAPSTALTNCMVRTRAILNLRAAPSGRIIGLVPWEAWLTAFNYSDGWFYIDYHGERGWISADYVEPRGDFCG